MSRRRLHLMLQSIGAIAWLVIQGASIASAGQTGALQAADAARQAPQAAGPSHPIIDTHIHFFQPSRPGGVPWPPPGSDPLLYRDVLPPEYKAMAMANGILASGVVEASPLVEDNQWILNLLGQAYFTGKAAAEITYRPVAAPDQAILSECRHQHVEMRLVGSEVGRRGPPMKAVANHVHIVE